MTHEDVRPQLVPPAERPFKKNQYPQSWFMTAQCFGALVTETGQLATLPLATQMLLQQVTSVLALYVTTKLCLA